MRTDVSVMRKVIQEQYSLTRRMSQRLDPHKFWASTELARQVIINDMRRTQAVKAAKEKR